jgi:uncharacterized lipoprotein YddW (UPF0748 family)
MNQVFRLITAFPLLLLLGSISHADEFRGLYVDAFHPGFKSHEEVTQMVGAAKAANFNALIVQVRKRGDAYYNSKIEPKASDIASDYDPLADIITQAHKQGLEVHAWLCVYEVSHTKYTSLPASHIARAHPAWLMADRKGKTTVGDGKIYVDPGVPAVREHFVSVVTDVLRNYQVDGIHLDNIRYPYANQGYNATSVAGFNQKHGRTGVPTDDDPLWCEWRRDQITALVRDVSTAVSSIKPSVKLSVAGILTPQTSSTMFFQDYEAWTRDSLVDFVIAMLYLTDDKMPEYASSALRAAHARHVYIGIGAFRLMPDLALKQIADARVAGARGVALYSYHYLGPDTPKPDQVRLQALAASVFAESAVIPTMPWK